jgi:meso-butanediol dehydrogenase / (S,S)-butanediol dehydrogenase / diacetyl reductase
VVNVASASAFSGHAYLAHYAASKAALVSLTKSLAMEFMHSPVRINAIAPGGINTAMTASSSLPDGIDFQLIARYSPLRGSSEPEDLTDLILMLAGPRGKAIHGACLNADRGSTAG